jgi:hypothetical protein
VTPNPLYDGKTTLQKWLSLDVVGGLLSLAFITTLLLPLQWGGNTKAWSDPVVIGLLATVREFSLATSFLWFPLFSSTFYNCLHSGCQTTRRILIYSFTTHGFYR